MKCDEWDTACRQTSPREPSFGERRQMFLPDITHEHHAEHAVSADVCSTLSEQLLQDSVEWLYISFVSNAEWYHGIFRPCSSYKLQGRFFIHKSFYTLQRKEVRL